MSYPKNYKNNCIIYNKYLYSDLEDYTLNEINTVLKMQYTSEALQNRFSTATTKTETLKNIIDLTRPSLTETELYDIWLPALITNNDHIQNKECLFGGVMGSKVLGIEEAIKFSDVHLKSWKPELGSLDLCCDWIINNNLSSYDVEYGVLFWYKFNSIHKSETQYSIDQIPPGTRIKPVQDLTFTRQNRNIIITANETIVKITNDKIKLLNKDSSKFDPTTGKFVFNTSEETEIIPLSDIQNIQNKLFFVEDNKNLLSDSLKNYDIFISNGEFYSYFLGDKDKYDRQEFSPIKMPSRSYLSPSLYHIYRSIYNTLTTKRIKKFDGLGPCNRLEKLKKLCYILASSPLIDKVNINYLLDDELQKTIYSEYIDKPAKSSTSEETTELLDIIAKIFTFYKSQSVFLQKQTLAGNYITNQKDLFRCLTNKYGAYIKISSDVKIKYKNQFSYDTQLYINTDIKSYIDKNMNTDVDIYNDCKIELGDLYLETQMNPNISSSGCVCKLGHTTNQTLTVVPLSNMALGKTAEKLLTGFNKDIKLKLDVPGEIQTYSNIIDLTIDYDTGNSTFDEFTENISCSTSLVDGPDCLRFSDVTTNGNATKDRGRYNRTSADFSPSFHIRQTGLYTIQFTTTIRSSLKSIEEIRLYVHNDDYEYAPGLKVPSLMEYRRSNDIISSIKKYHVMIPNLRTIAFNKGGMLWFIDTDMYIADATYEDFARDRRLIDKRIIFNTRNENNTEISKEPINLKFTFKPNNTTIKLYNISLEYMRDDKDEHSQCKSFYYPKAARTRQKPIPDTILGDTILGAPNFRRINKYPDTYKIYSHFKTDNNVWNRILSPLEFGLPFLSTINAPNVYSYGGYSQSVVQDIGVEIPYHPIKIDNEIKSFKKIPPNTFWNTKPTDMPRTEAESGLIASDPAPLNRMSLHNDLGGQSSQVRCYKKKIPVTGCISFDKGYFHPNSGWYYYAPTGYNPRGVVSYSSLSLLPDNNPNISSIQKFDTEKYGSYRFLGQGFYDLRSNNSSYIAGSGYVNAPMMYQSAIKIIVSGDLPGYDDPKTDYNYGIRNVNTDFTEPIDDFICVRNEEADADFNCEFVTSNTYILPKPSMNNLTIEDLELKLNLMNFTNPKNLVFALEVHNPDLDAILDAKLSDIKDKIFLSFADIDRTTDPMTWASQMNTSLENNNVSILNFIKSHKDTNTLQEKPNTRILYLYNQESLDNYNYHFNLIFSDNADKRATFTDESKISISGINYYNNPIKNSQTILPCVSPTGYSEQDSVLFREIIKNNRMNILDGAFAKFKKLPLRNTTFTLKVFMLGLTENIQNLDNTMLNSQLSGLSTFANKRVSNSIVNSLCNWELIIHTKNVSKFTTTDYLGSIDYESAKISRSGYNFIADMTGKEYLIPKVNINAPYQYTDINTCKYINNDALSQPLSYERIAFPYYGAYIPTFFTLVGALADISALASQMGLGGRADPIVNMLYNIKFQEQQAEQEYFYFKPVYNKQSYLGTPSKALIQASKDGLNWYRMEVPIFKYDNVSLLTPNKFKYLKLHKDIAAPLSNFPFTIVTDIFDCINPSDIVFTTARDEPLSGLTVNVSDTETRTLSEYDIVSVVNQENPAQNGLYYARLSSWIRYPDPGVPTTIKNNNLLGNNQITIKNIRNNKIISILGSRAYNLFDENDQICIMKTPGASVVNSDLFFGVIVKKAIINIKNNQVTLFILEDPVPNNMKNGYIGKSLDNSNVLILYKDHISYNDNTDVQISGSAQTSVGKWGLNKSHLNKEHINQNILDQHSVAVSECAVGYGSNYLHPNKYSFIEPSYPNKILNTDDIFNNHINDKLKYNNITVLQYKDNSIQEIKFSTANTKKELLQGFPFRYDDAKYNLDALYNYNLIFSSGFRLDGSRAISTSGVALTGVKLENLKQSLKDSLSANNTDYYFIDLKSDQFINQITSVSGEIILENDFLKHIPLQPLEEDKKKMIKDRLKQLNTKSPVSLTSSNINLQTISSIPDLEQFYSSLPPDPTGCFKKYFDANPGIEPIPVFTDQERLVRCSGQIAKQKLSALYMEKNNLLRELELDKQSTPNILPYSVRTIDQDAMTQEISIKYTQKQYYMLNIDPNQICRLSDDVSIKILKSIKYICVPIIINYQYGECDSICKGLSLEVGGGLTYLSGEEESIQGATFLFYFNEEEKINKEKAKYPDIKEWDDTATLRTSKEFFMACEDAPMDILVKVTEEYIQPKYNDGINGLVKDIFNLDTNSKVLIKFRNIPRKLQKIDSYYVRYVYDFYGRLGIDQSYGGGNVNGGFMYNDFYGWKCIKTQDYQGAVDHYPNNKLGDVVDPPDFYKWMNEMIFRGFFGSVDGIEHKNTNIIEPKEDWEWIPYEYYFG